MIEQLILDPCCGSRMFWFDKADDRVVFCDQRIETHPLNDRILSIEPDVQADFRNMPFPDNTFSLVVFDPPHLKVGGDTGWQVKKYGILTDNWRNDLKAGFAECFRVLKTGHTLIFKWNQIQIPTHEILKLTDRKPLFGHISGKRSDTHWIVFIKD